MYVTFILYAIVSPYFSFLFDTIAQLDISSMQYVDVTYSYLILTFSCLVYKPFLHLFNIGIVFFYWLLQESTLSYLLSIVIQFSHSRVQAVNMLKLIHVISLLPLKPVVRSSGVNNLVQTCSIPNIRKMSFKTVERGTTNTQAYRIFFSKY